MDTARSPAAESVTDWIDVGPLDEIPPLGARVVKRQGGDIAVFRASDDSVFALLNRCPHKGGPLSEGIVFGHSVACPLHNWCLDLATGQARAPDEGQVPRFPTRVYDGRILLCTTPDTDRVSTT